MLVVDGVEMLEVREAALLVGRTAETVRRWVWSGRLPACKSANRLLVAREDVQRLVTERPQPTDLGAWGEQARAAFPAHRRAGVTASDLVLTDRQERRAGR
jgi:excisionase family DNA binding protein